MNRWTTSSADETEAVGRSLASELEPDGVLLLIGDLGSGKTVLTRGVAAGLGIAPEQVQSPTFTLMREHAAGGQRLIHVDLYRLDVRDVGALALEEVLAGPGVKVVEWAERLDFPVAGAIVLRLTRGADSNARIIEKLDEKPRTGQKGERR